MGYTLHLHAEVVLRKSDIGAMKRIAWRGSGTTVTSTRSTLPTPPLVDQKSIPSGRPADKLAAQASSRSAT